MPRTKTDVDYPFQTSCTMCEATVTVTREDAHEHAPDRWSEAQKVRNALVRRGWWKTARGADICGDCVDDLD
jgi:SOS response regulatory protein OraA/RecX